MHIYLYPSASESGKYTCAVPLCIKNEVTRILCSMIGYARRIQTGYRVTSLGNHPGWMASSSRAIRSARARGSHGLQQYRSYTNSCMRLTSISWSRLDRWSNGAPTCAFELDGDHSCEACHPRYQDGHLSSQGSATAVRGTG